MGFIRSVTIPSGAPLTYCFRDVHGNLQGHGADAKPSDGPASIDHAQMA
jgi:hypothetical protein